jgi:hypothetical protein
LLRSGTVELLEGEPSAEISDAVRATVEEVRQRFGLDESARRTGYVGPSPTVSRPWGAGGVTGPITH